MVNPSSHQSCPAISVIIPMYNAEKYIGECLNSVLAQTFTNFEIIVVNDCSTDNSTAIVESYREKFGGRLKFYHMEKNSGSGAMPRNKGMMISRGEYIFFMDSDDQFTKTALEELYTLAKEYNANVVYCEKFYEVNADGSGIHTVPGANKKVKLVDKPTFETDNMAKRVQKILQRKYRVTPWCKLVRRDFMIENEINFPHCAISEDDIWTYGLVFYAKKFLRVPNIVYTRCLSENSVGRKKKNPQQTITFWINPVVRGVKALDKLMSKHEFFQNNLDYHYALLSHFIEGSFSCLLGNSFRLKTSAVYKTIKQEFGDKLGKQDVLIPALCTVINTQQKIMAINQQEFNQFAAQAQARIAELEAQLKTK